jgi:membrane complex biogenesis BtpA family protein
MDRIVARARQDAEAYAQGGLDGLILENYGDLPFFPQQVPPETVAAMTFVAAEILRVTALPVGINALRNDALAALGVATAVGARFIRVNVLMGAMVADQGIIEGQAHILLRRRRELGASVYIFADVMVKHARPLGGGDLAESARELAERGLADALIVTGQGTGERPALEDLRKVKEATPHVPVLAGSGVTTDNALEILSASDGAIVGTSLKRDGQTESEVDIARIRMLMTRLGR